MHINIFPDLGATGETFVIIDEALLELLDRASQLNSILTSIQEDMEEFTEKCKAKRICVENVPNSELEDLSNELETVSYKNS